MPCGFVIIFLYLWSTNVTQGYKMRKMIPNVDIFPVHVLYMPSTTVTFTRTISAMVLGTGSRKRTMISDMSWMFWWVIHPPQPPPYTFFISISSCHLIFLHYSCHNYNSCWRASVTSMTDPVIFSLEDSHSLLIKRCNLCYWCVFPLTALAKVKENM